MNPLLWALLVAIGVMGFFLLLARLSMGNANYRERLARFVGDSGKGRSEEEKKARKPFSLGIGESQLSVRVEKTIGRQSYGKTIQRKMAQADLKLTILEFMLFKLLTTMLGLAVGLFFGRGGAVQMVLFGLGGLVVGFFAPDWYVKFRISRRLKAFNEQLGDTIALLANSLRSGYSLLQSMELVARESSDPIAFEFKRVVREVGLGISPQQALQNLYRRMPSDDLDLMITAINIQYEVGGNLAQILDVLAHTIRERVRIKGEIQVLTAQGRLTGYLISALPLIIGLAVSVINPQYMNPMWEFPWVIMPVCGGILLVIGFLVIRKIVDIEV